MAIAVPTHKVKTPIGGHTVVLKDYLTGYDDEAIQAIFTDQTFEIDPKKAAGKDPMDAIKSLKVDGKMIQRVEREGVSRVVTSINGDSEHIIDDVYNMHKLDKDFVLAEVQKITDPEDNSDPKD